MHSILAVDDSVSMRQMVSYTLKSAGFEVVEAVDGEDAFEKARQRHFDLVLTDVTLKGELSGRDVVQRIRIDFAYGKRRLPVLVMTGDANPRNQSELLRQGANDLVLKPIEERRLVTKALFQLRLARLPEPTSLDAE